ncbi:DUF4974 domain-containing protein [Pedobacter sp. HMF7647]|uniref:DUF4974 domain-containing protein n=1 Tax=Hufsiella arboris TaxID=2695275 RepID=A0A7K1YD17_9SPHI|nr:FecR domain-containing protein [Hufsiella arboris]MXV52477.1 DUF4974 domain-containing protein [Hufsiella arboris]
MSSDRYHQLIKKYLRGDCSNEEREQLYAWFERQNQADDPLPNLSLEERDLLKQRIFNQVKENCDLPRSERKRLGDLRSLVYLASSAAAVFLIVGAIYFFRPSDQPVAALATDKLTFINKTKTIKRQSLSDGSSVWLNPESSLTIPKSFTGNYRKVSLKGDAFFEVTKDAKHPFVIRSENLITKVLGTSFRIRTLPNHRSEVSVVTGKVSVEIPGKNNSKILLLPEEKIVYNPQTNYLKTEREPAASPMKIWRKTTLSFDDVALSDVIAILNKKFGSSIEINDDVLKSYLLKADFTDQSLPEILEMLEKSLSINYEINEGQIILKRNN